MTTDVFAALRDALNASITDEIPDDFKTVEDWAYEWGKSRVQAGALIRRAYQRGLMDRQMYRIDIGPCVRPVAHYRYIGGDACDASATSKKR